MDYKDYYAILGVPKTATPGRDQEGLSQARPRAPSGHEQGARRREALQGGERGAGRPDRSGEAEAVRRARRQLAGVPAGRLRLRRRDRLGGLRRRAGRHAMEVPHGSAEEMGGFSDFFRQFFGGGRRSQQPVRWRFGRPSSTSTSRTSAARARRPRSIPSAQATAEVTLAEVATGAERHGQRQRPAAAREDPRRRRRRLEGQAERRGRRRRPRHQRARSSPIRVSSARADLRTELPLTLAEALLGGEVPVPTPDRQREAAHPAEHAERPGDPRSRVAACRSAARRRRATWSSRPGSCCRSWTTRRATRLEPILAAIPQPDPASR